MIGQRSLTYCRDASQTNYNWTATGLPPGLSISPTTGAISGYPTVTGTSRVTVTVTAPLGSASSEFSLTVAVPPKTIGCQPGKCV